MQIGSYIRIRNNGKNNRGTTEEQLRNTDNNDNNIIFNLLLNKYRKNFPKTFSEKIKVIRKIREMPEYLKLDLDEQDKLFLELINMRREEPNEKTNKKNSI